MIVPEKDIAARALATIHGDTEESILKVVRLRGDREGDPNEPIKLLELNRNTVPSGIVPIFFGPSGELPFSSVVVELTEPEFERVERRELSLPDNWRLGEVLFSRPNGKH